MARIEGKARFLNTLKSEEIRNNVFKVLAILDFYSALKKKTYSVPAGLICDFETAGILRTSNEAGALHDYFYRCDSEPVLERKEADDLYYEAMIADGTPKPVAYLKWMTVRAVGWKYYHKCSVNHVPKG